MLTRCYDENCHRRNASYKNCRVNKRWHNFQNFVEDIQYLEGYDKWKEGKNKKRNPMELDKDIKVPGNRIYSKDTCIFATKAENAITGNITGKTYIATRIFDGYVEEFTNQTRFAQKYKLTSQSVNYCCTGKQKQHKGWTFKIKEETT